MSVLGIILAGIISSFLVSCLMQNGVRTFGTSLMAEGFFGFLVLAGFSAPLNYPSADTAIRNAMLAMFALMGLGMATFIASEFNAIRQEMGRRHMK